MTAVGASLQRTRGFYVSRVSGSAAVAPLQQRARADFSKHALRRVEEASANRLYAGDGLSRKIWFDHPRCAGPSPNGGVEGHAIEAHTDKWAQRREVGGCACEPNRDRLSVRVCPSRYQARPVGFTSPRYRVLPVTPYGIVNSERAFYTAGRSTFIREFYRSRFGQSASSKEKGFGGVHAIACFAGGGFQSITGSPSEVSFSSPSVGQNIGEDFADRFQGISFVCKQQSTGSRSWSFVHPSKFCRRI
jgi:hypothetical protein